MNNLTGDFDLAVQVTGPAIERLVKAMHGSGIFRHVFVRAYQNRSVELIINCPGIFLIPAAPPDEVTRATAGTRVLYHSRNIGDPTDPGTSVVVDVILRVKLYLTNGDPAPLNANTYLAADWSETSAADITVYSADPNVIAEAQGALLDFIASEGGGSYPVPPIGTTQPIGSLAFQFIQTSGNWVAIGMNVGAAMKGSKTQLNNAFVGGSHDWGLAISSDYAVAQIFSQVSAQLGGLPPPLGPNHVLLSDSTVCVLPNPFGGCIASADQKVFLESLNIALQNGQIAISGTLSQTTYVLVPITVTASFQASATLSIGPGQVLQISVSQPSVQLQQWYAQLLNDILGGAFTTAIANGIQASLQSSGGSALSNIVSPATLQAITSLGGSASINVGVTTDTVSITSDAIITQGSLDVQGLNVFPVASAVAVRGPAALTLNLNALASWAPAHRETLLSWDFGDGSPQFNSSDTVPGVAVSYTWAAAGEYLVTLVVSNEDGMATSTQFLVKPGILELLAPQANNISAPWAVCSQAGSFSVTFTVLASGYPAPDASVVIRTSTSPYKYATAYTNQLGQATFTIDDSMFTAPPPAGSAINVVGGMLVNAFCKDYLWAWNYLWLWDCITITNWPPHLLKKFTTEIMKMTRYANSTLSAAPSLARDVALAQSLVTTLSQLVVRGSNILPLDVLLGSKHVAKQREQLEHLVDHAVNRLAEIRSAADQELHARRIGDKHIGLIDVGTVAVSPAHIAKKAETYKALVARLHGHQAPKEHKKLPNPTYKIAPAKHAVGKRPKPEEQR